MRAASIARPLAREGDAVARDALELAGEVHRARAQPSLLAQVLSPSRRRIRSTRIAYVTSASKPPPTGSSPARVSL